MYLRNKIILWVLSLQMAFLPVVHADPKIGDMVLPPASFTYIQDYDLLVKLGLDGFDGAWCYDNHANAILITGASRAKAVCELTTQYELEKQKVKYQFDIDRLSIRLETAEKQHLEILKIKDEEIERLTAAALKRPNDYTLWWGLGGVATGVALTLLTGWAISSASGGL